MLDGLGAPTGAKEVVDTWVWGSRSARSDWDVAVNAGRREPSATEGLDGREAVAAVSDTVPGFRKNPASVWISVWSASGSAERSRLWSPESSMVTSLRSDPVVVSSASTFPVKSRTDDCHRRVGRFEAGELRPFRDKKATFTWKPITYNLYKMGCMRIFSGTRGSRQLLK